MAGAGEDTPRAAAGITGNATLTPAGSGGTLVDPNGPVGNYR